MNSQKVGEHLDNPKTLEAREKKRISSTRKQSEKEGEGGGRRRGNAPKLGQILSRQLINWKVAQATFDHQQHQHHDALWIKVDRSRRGPGN